MAAKKSARKKIAALKEKIEIQRRRAARPTLPINTRAQVSETLVQRKRRAEKERERRKDWENL